MYIKLFSSCLLVNGVTRASIIDIQREQIFFIPLSLYSLIDKQSYAINEKISDTLDQDSKSIFDEYLNFLLENELAFYCKENELARFPKISEEFCLPAHISNCLIDSNGDNITNFSSEFFAQLADLCCNHIQLRLYKNIDFAQLKEFLALINENQIKTFEIVIPADEYLMVETNIINILENNRKLTSLIVTSSNEYKIIRADECSGTAILTDEKINSNLHCGIINLNQFSVNLMHYTEALRYNSCLNRKIAIDTDGAIKNCPSMKENFGNVKDTLLKDAITHPNFKKYWNINKDYIDKCKDCEFRYVCTDCRAYREDPANMYSAPLKCGYNPYTCEWEEWSINPLKVKGIEYYNMQELKQLV